MKWCIPRKKHALGLAMEDGRGRLSAAQKEKFVAWLDEKGKDHACPVCKTNSWSIGEHLLNGFVHVPNAGLVLTGASYPMAFVVCNNCAYTRQFMAVPIGLLDAPETNREDGKDG